MMPWGTDQTWESNIPFDDPAGGVMFNKCLADESCRQLYLEGLRGLYCVAPGLDLPSHADRLGAMLAPYQAREDPSKRETTSGEIAEELERFRTLAGARPGDLEEYLISEGALGAEADPCALPEPEGPNVPIAVAQRGTPPPSSVESGKAKIGGLRVNGAFVLTRLQVTGAAKATLRVFTRIDGRRHGLCADQSERAAAGRLTVRCRLPGWVLERLADGPLKLKARIGFFPQLGTARTALRSLTVPHR
jgi:hypothetical protein